SDYDVRFVYIRSVTDYVRLRPLRDVIELPIDNALPNPLDVNGWDIVKALNLFRSSNPPLLEWLSSPIVYQEQGELAARLRAISQEDYSPMRMSYHYLSMAKRTHREYLAGRDDVSLKKYLYALRPLFAVRWMEQQRTPPPTQFEATLEGITFAHEIRSKLSDLLQRKRLGGETGAEAKDVVLTEFIEAEIERISGIVRDLPDPEMSEVPLNALLWSELKLRETAPRKDELEHGH
ncbi:MAG: ycgL, partial [Chthonomonadaceae bacterium]|nr:ycgL [Chthonomonadaceae bacterium]